MTVYIAVGFTKGEEGKWREHEEGSRTFYYRLTSEGDVIVLIAFKDRWGWALNQISNIFQGEAVKKAVLIVRHCGDQRQESPWKRHGFWNVSSGEEVQIQGENEKKKIWKVVGGFLE